MLQELAISPVPCWFRSIDKTRTYSNKWVLVKGKRHDLWFVGIAGMLCSHSSCSASLSFGYFLHLRHGPFPTLGRASWLARHAQWPAISGPFQTGTRCSEKHVSIPDSKGNGFINLKVPPVACLCRDQTCHPGLDLGDRQVSPEEDDLAPWIWNGPKASRQGQPFVVPSSVPADSCCVVASGIVYHRQAEHHGSNTAQSYSSILSSKYVVFNGQIPPSITNQHKCNLLLPVFRDFTRMQKFCEASGNE